MLAIQSESHAFTLVSLMLAKGADPTKKTRYARKTPLMFAAKKGCFALTLLLYCWDGEGVGSGAPSFLKRVWIRFDNAPVGEDEYEQALESEDHKDSYYKGAYYRQNEDEDDCDIEKEWNLDDDFGDEEEDAELACRRVETLCPLAPFLRALEFPQHDINAVDAFGMTALCHYMGSLFGVWETSPSESLKQLRFLNLLFDMGAHANGISCGSRTPLMIVR